MSKDILQLQKTGEEIFKSQPKCPVDLVILTYGAYVSKLLREVDDNDPQVVNQQLDQLFQWIQQNQRINIKDIGLLFQNHVQ